MPKLVTRNKRAPRLRRRIGAGTDTTGDAVGKYASDAWSLAKRTAYGLNEIRKFINIETKYFDATGSGQVNYNGSVSSLSQIAQGLDISNRVGDSIRLQHITFRGDVTTDSTALWTAMRIVIFRDLAQAGSAPAVSDLLQTVGTIHATDSMYNRLNLQRFSILFDEMVTVSNVGPAQDFIYFDSAHQGHIRYLGTTAAAASEGLGSLYVCFVTDRVSTLPTITWTARIAYTDD